MSHETVQYRIASVAKYIDTLFQIHSKLEVVRVDFSYLGGAEAGYTLEHIKSDITRMMNNRRTNATIFGDLVGYVISFEYGLDRGTHAHALFFFDGQRVQSGEYRGQLLGEYWRNNITDDAGIYHLCKASDYSVSGLGRVNYHDLQKRAVLVKVADYLTKTEQQPDSWKGQKLFIKGQLPRSISNVGRPRLYKPSELRNGFLGGRRAEA